jgi:signal transduction histidine kinase
MDWPELNIDTGKIREVLLIVIENAVKYNHKGGRITIQAGMTDAKFEMTVENTGAGLVAEDREKLFNHLFYRSEQAKKANPVGMGIGLSVARAIVRAHHGELTIESDGEGRGARVRIGIPEQLRSSVTSS